MYYLAIEGEKGMLEVTGKSCSSLDAIEFFESLVNNIPDNIKTKEFCERYEQALNRFRYEVAKDIGKRKRIVKTVHRRYYDFKYCGKCGFGANEPSYNFCPNCGTRYIVKD